MDSGLKLSIIAAVAENGVIGANNAIPWHLPSDLRRFAKLTKGHPVIVGRKTHESIVSRLGHPLPHRRTIVVSRRPAPDPLPDCLTVKSLEAAFEESSSRSGEVFVIGGEQLYRLALPLADRLYLTTVHANPDGDTFFPPYNPAAWMVDPARTERYLIKPVGDDAPSSFEVFHRRVTPVRTTNATSVLMANARQGEQAAVMERFLASGLCPFCPPHNQQAELQPVVRWSRYWQIRPNRWPYAGTTLHFLLIANQHVETLGELSAEALSELLTLCQWLEAKFGVRSGAVGLRFGNPAGNGATVAHLHAHLIVAQPNPEPGSKRVRFPMGPKT